MRSFSAILLFALTSTLHAQALTIDNQSHYNLVIHAERGNSSIPSGNKSTVLKQHTKKKYYLNYELHTENFPENTLVVHIDNAKIKMVGTDASLFGPTAPNVRLHIKKKDAKFKIETWVGGHPYYDAQITIKDK